MIGVDVLDDTSMGQATPKMAIGQARMKRGIAYVPDWVTRRIWWRFVLFGVIVGQIGTVVSGQWRIRYLISLAALIPAIILLHPIMDQPVKFFGPVSDRRRFRWGLVCSAIAVGFLVTTG